MGNLDFYVPKDLQIFYSLLSFKAEEKKKDSIFLNWDLWISCVFTLIRWLVQGMLILVTLT